MNNISSIKDCYGCGVCAAICPDKIISITLNADGFYTPQLVDIDLCTECGLCTTVCAFADSRVCVPSALPKPVTCAVWSKNDEVLAACSSGGVGFELAFHFLGKGYKACGVRYNAGLNRAEHFIANSVEEFLPARGSKYIQSYTYDAFSGFNRTDKYFVVGTPCQIDSLRRYIKKRKIEDNFILVDFFCHGVPSKLMWDKYLDRVRKQVGYVDNVTWRNKEYGWHDSPGVKVEKNGEKKYSSRLSEGDLFFRFFLRDRCLSKACYADCKYRYVSSAADIRMGDLWGKKYEENEKGVSGIIVYTERGKEALDGIKDSCVIVDEPLSVVAEYQMKAPPRRTKLYSVVAYCLKTSGSLAVISSVADTMEGIYNLPALPKRVYQYIKRISFNK